MMPSRKLLFGVNIALAVLLFLSLWVNGREFVKGYTVGVRETTTAFKRTLR